MNTLPEGTIRCRVIRQQREQYGIADEQGNEYAARVSGKYMNSAAAADDYPAVGDYVAARIEGDTAIIHALFPRKSAFVRKVSGKTFAAQVVAANVDTVFLCMSLNENFNARRMERYVAAAWESGARPVIVLTKADICSDVDAKLNELYSAAPGVDIAAVCAMDGTGMDKLSPYIAKGETIAFVGSSGVGKSTLINRLTGSDTMQTGAISGGGRGRHTTTHRELIPLANGATLIDTPGMRELGMMDAEAGIEAAFEDIEQAAHRCRFADCTHTNEPGCAVRAAIERGEVSRERFESYKKLSAENERAADSKAYLDAKRQKFKAIAKYNKANKKR